MEIPLARRAVRPIRSELSGRRPAAVGSGWRLRSQPRPGRSGWPCLHQVAREAAHATSLGARRVQDVVLAYGSEVISIVWTPSDLLVAKGGGPMRLQSRYPKKFRLRAAACARWRPQHPGCGPWRHQGPRHGWSLPRPRPRYPRAPRLGPPKSARGRRLRRIPGHRWIWSFASRNGPAPPRWPVPAGRTSAAAATRGPDSGLGRTGKPDQFRNPQVMRRPHPWHLGRTCPPIGPGSPAGWDTFPAPQAPPSYLNETLTLAR